MEMREWRKGRKAVIGLLLFVLVFTMSTGTALAAGSTASTDFSKGKCTISDTHIYGDTMIQLEFKMEKNLKAKGFQVYRSTSKNGKYSLVATTAYGMYTDTNVKKGKVYYYKVRGYKTVNGRRVYSQFSQPVSKRFTTGPVYISNLEVSASGMVTGSILKNKNAEGYYIYYATSEKGPYKLAKKVSGSNLKLKFQASLSGLQCFIKTRGYITSGGKKYFGEYSDAYEVIAGEDRKVAISNPEVKAALGGGTVTVGDLAFQDELYFEDIDCKDADFKFLKYCVHLETLHFNRCTLESVATICKSLPEGSLKELYLDFTSVTDISPLKRLKNLEFLDMESTPVWDFSVLAAMPKLKEVSYDMQSANAGVDKPFDITNFKGVKAACEAAGIKCDLGSNVEEWLAVEKVMDDFIAREITASMSDYEKVKKAHDFVCKTVTYGSGSSKGCKLTMVYCPLVEGHGVCQDYADAFGYLTARMGFETYFVGGDGSATREDHAWNIIKLGDTYYHVDCTWDDPTGGGNVPRYTYFLKSDSTLRSLRDYKWDTKNLPGCPADYAA